MDDYMERVVHTFENGVMVYDDHLTPVQRERYLHRNVHEADEEDVFAKLVRSLPPNSCYINIGAAIGYYAILAKKLSPELMVHAVEPLKRHRRYFIENIALNSLTLSDINIHAVGIAAINGEAIFIDNGFGSAIGNHSDLNGVESDKVSLIKTRNLDNLLTEIPSSVELCQMDVQGHEFEVLQGARVALRDGRVSTFLIGTHGRKIHSDCARLLIENGYQVEFELIDSQLQPDGILVASKGVTRLSAPSSFKEFKPTIGKPASRNLSFCPESYAYYRDLSADGAKNKSAPFILIDSKSLPRSGLHYLKKTFSRLLDENFSFCEWYHEPGCCRKMPCTYTDYASKCHQKGMAGVRLVKSHDFDLADPEFPTLYNLRRLILVRDPLYILTSWFCLDQLELYETELSKAGINLIKIAYLHEPEVLASAFQLLEKNFCPPAKEQLADWIHKRTEYIHEFIAKWVVPATEQQQHFTNVVRYEEINQYILEILNEIREFLPEHAQRKIDDFAKHPAGYFSARGNPFQAPSAKLTAYLLENASQFKSAAESINDFWGAATQKKCALQKCRNNLPKISIVTPSYNQSEYLEECIVSVLSQNYPNLEYIIMDGGSTDGSVEIIKKYEKHLTYWQSQPDGGQYVATNEGFRRSTGEIMGWLNSDDKLHPGALHQVALAFRAMPQTEWITGRPTAWDDQGRLITVFDHVPSWSLERLLYHRKDDYYIQQESTFWRRSLWDRAGGGLDTNWQLAADFELWCRFFRYSELTGVDALFGGFRYHSGQKTDTMMDHYEQEVLQIIDRERRSPAKHNAQSRPPDVVDMGDIISAVTPELTPDAFSYFSYSRRPHFNWFAASAQKLFGSAVDPDYCDLKMYQDLLCYTFIVDNLPKSSRILEVGGGDSRVLKALKNDYECWNVDKLEGVGNGLKEVVVDGYRMVRAYLGDFSEELADGYFDLVFSISALEHVAENEENFKNICSDMDRVMKPGAFSLHCLDVVAKQDNVRTNSFMPFLFRRYKTKNQLTPFEQMVQDPSLYCMSEAAYERGWRNITKVSYKEFGRPLSCNILWQKTDDQSVSVLPSLQGMVPDLKSLIAWYYDQNKDGFTASEKALLYSAIEGPLNFLQEIEGPLFADTHTGRLVKQIMLSRHGRAIRDALPKFRPYCLNYFPQMMIKILSDGAVTTCCFDAYGDNQFGSIYEKQLSDIWEHDLPRVMQGDLYDHKRCLQCIGYQGWAPLVNEEGKREEWLEWMSKTPNEIQIEITAHCNYACVFCASASIRQQRSAFLDLDKTFENIRGMLKNTHKINLYNYGEPLLHQGLSDFIHKCRAESSELILELATNGMQLNEKISRALIENRVDRIIVSVHGGPGTENMLKYSSHGADYDVVLNNVRQLLQLRKTLNSQVPKVSLRAILFHWNDNDEDMNRFRDDARALGLSATWGHYDTDNYHWILDSGSQLASKKYISGSAGLKALVASREFLSCRLYEEECKRNGDSGGGGQTEEPAKVVVATSIAPKNIEQQKSAVTSWSYQGFKVVSVNTEPEIAILKSDFPDVTFVATKRDARETMGRPLIFLDDVFAALKSSPATVCGIINSDIHLRTDIPLYDFVASEAKAAFICGHRYDVENLSDAPGKLYLNGYDIFFFDTSLLDSLPSSPFCLGATWLDIWVPLAMILKNVPAKRIIAPLAFHVLHTNRWDKQEWLQNSSRLVTLIDSNKFDLSRCSDFVDNFKRFYDLPQGLYKLCRDFIIEHTQLIAPEQMLPEGVDPALQAPSYLVSAIVSTYNAEKFFSDCICNLIGQSLYEKGQLEIIIINSGSEQNEERIAQYYIETHDHIVYQRTERESLYAAWNRAIKLAKGKYIVNANTDDTLRVDALELLAAALDIHPVADLAYGDCALTRKPNDSFSNHHAYHVSDYPPYNPALGMLFCLLGPHPMWRKTLFNEIGMFAPTYRAAGDYEFQMRFIMAGRSAIHVPEVLSLFCQNVEGLSLATETSSREAVAIESYYRTIMPINRLYAVDPDCPAAVADAWVAQGNLSLAWSCPWLEHAPPQLDYAVSCYRKALEVDRNNQPALQNLCALMALQGNWRMFEYLADCYAPENNKLKTHLADKTQPDFIRVEAQPSVKPLVFMVPPA